MKPRILAVDDSEDLLALMGKALGADYDVVTASNGGAALMAAVAEPQPTLILLDIEMPGMNGFDVCKALKGNASTAAIPVIFLTGKGEKKDEMHGFEVGAVDYVAKPINVAVLRARVGTHVALASRHAALEGMVRERTAKLEHAHMELIRCLGRAMESHESAAVGNRFQRIGQYAKLVALALGAKAPAAELLEKAAPLHDIGKLAVPAEILRKPGSLSAPDWERVRRHPEYGAAIIGQHEDPMLQLARTVALTHHENWDGAGYPKGLKGEAIPWMGRVVAVVDAFEAMTTTQFHRDPMTIEQATREIVNGAGKRFDPKIVEAFLKALPDMRKVHASVSDQLQDIIDLDFSATAAKTAAAVGAVSPRAPGPALDPAAAKAAAEKAAAERAASAKVAMAEAAAARVAADKAAAAAKVAAERAAAAAKVAAERAAAAAKPAPPKKA
jgi:putative two-component system response regulator